MQPGSHAEGGKTVKRLWIVERNVYLGIDLDLAAWRMIQYNNRMFHSSSRSSRHSSFRIFRLRERILPSTHCILDLVCSICNLQSTDSIGNLLCSTICICSFHRIGCNFHRTLWNFKTSLRQEFYAGSFHPGGRIRHHNYRTMNSRWSKGSWVCKLLCIVRCSSPWSTRPDTPHRFCLQSKRCSRE